MKRIAIVVLCSALGLHLPAIADRCSTNEEDHLNNAYCKKQTASFLGGFDAFAWGKCMKARNQNDCARRKQEQAEKMERLGAGSPCWRLGIAIADYSSCIKERNDPELEEEVKRMEVAGRDHYHFGNFSRIVEDEREKRRAVVAKAKYEKENAERQAGIKRYEAEIKRFEQEALVADEKKKKLCGNDYRRVRVGMTLSRVRQCIADPRMVSQVNRKDGVVSVYSLYGGHIYVMEDKIIAWEAR